ncbi:TPA: exodeoxyribonuclease VII large subunit, partial [Acinetobacter baumannii]|nr:exodeoxyribonuclease VII large subunit [Acinetobacter baumannii]
RSFDTPSKVIAGIRNHIIERVQEAVDNLQTIKLLSQHQITTYQSKSDQYLQHIKSSAQAQLNSAHQFLEQIKERIQFVSQQQVKFSLSQTESLMREILLQNPKQIQAKGYAIVRSEGKAIGSIHQITSSTITVDMQDGAINANITEVIPNE